MRERRRAGVAIVAIAMAGVSIAAWFGWRGEPTAPPPTAADVDAVPGAPPPLDVVTAAPTEADAGRSEVPRSAVRGIARDAAGAPLTDWSVRLERDHEPAAAGRSAADGTFAFVDLPAGRFGLHLQGAAGDGVELDLQPGDERHVELRLPPGACAFSARVSVDGRAPVDLRLCIACAGGGRVQCRPDRDGLAAALLPAGSHVVQAVSESAQRSPLGDGAVLDEWPLPIGPGVASVRWELDLVTPILVAQLDEPTGVRIADLVLVANGTTHFGSEARTFRSGKVPGRRAFLGVPPGRWEVELRSPYLCTLPPQTVEVRPGQRRTELTFAAERAGVVRLLLHRPDGSRFDLQLPPDLEGRLLWARWNGGARLAAMDLARRGWLGAARDYALVGVPLGRGALHWSDEIADGTAAFLPFDPPSPTTLEVVVDDRNAVALVVQPRARVDLTACEVGGRAMLGATLRLFAGEREVRSWPVPLTGRWVGFLPPGDYVARVTRADADVSEHRIAVQRRNLTMRLRR